MSDTTSYAGAAQPAAAMQAVIVVHGMGEQIPMDTIKSFVATAWETDTSLHRESSEFPHPSQVWSKPDPRTGSLELRRITTRESIAGGRFPYGVRTDFYELYWADLTAGSTWDQFIGWVGGLLFRPLSRVPHDVRAAWVVLWLASLIVLALAIVALAPDGMWANSCVPWLAGWHWLLAPAVAYLMVKLHRTATTTFGRVVRYTKADPDNIAARQAVRERGLKLLRALHQDHYQRIVVVGHSLGAMLAYDLLSYFWAEREAARKIEERSVEFDALCALEAAAAQVDRETPGALAHYDRARRDLRLELAARPAPSADAPAEQDTRWLITDFLTLGCPLSHAEFLIANDKKDLCDRKTSRELPKSPPLREELDPKVLERAVATGKLPIASPPEASKLISFPPPKSDHIWELHHGAPFAVVRWTNIYDPAEWVFFGDVIGGPVAPVFGPAITDIDLKERRGGRQSSSFTHTEYWTADPDDPTRIAAFREALNLLDKA